VFDYWASKLIICMRSLSLNLTTRLWGTNRFLSRNNCTCAHS